MKLAAKMTITNHHENHQACQPLVLNLITVIFQNLTTFLFKVNHAFAVIIHLLQKGLFNFFIFSLDETVAQKKIGTIKTSATHMTMTTKAANIDQNKTLQPLQPLPQQQQQKQQQQQQQPESQQDEEDERKAAKNPQGGDYNLRERRGNPRYK